MARLHEYQGKAILAANGFKIPRGRAASTTDESIAAQGNQGFGLRALGAFGELAASTKRHRLLRRRHCVKAKQKAATRLSVTADCEYGCLSGCAVLLIVDGHLRCRFAHFKLIAHFLDL